VAHLILTVTMNAALDRSVTVPNFQVGHRHRASSGFTQAGGKGINVARALKRLDLPVVASGLAGGRTGTRIVEELTAEAILNDFVRIGDESRTSTMVVDPTGGTSTEIYEWGPEVSADELATLLGKIEYLARGADLVVFAGSLPRGVDAGFYGEAIRECNRRRVRVVLDTEGEPLRFGVEGEPWLVSPNQREAESLVGQEFHDEEDFMMALDAIGELGARNVLIGHDAGAFLLVREERRAQRYQATIAPLEPVAQPAGAGDAMLAGYLAAREAERSPEEALRAAVATGAAATLEVGGGRFDPREASRLQGGVTVSAVEPLVSEH
jgi:1-phosphofructokinase family hexose kinase